MSVDSDIQVRWSCAFLSAQCFVTQQCLAHRKRMCCGMNNLILLLSILRYELTPSETLHSWVLQGSQAYLCGCDREDYILALLHV
jgi:hypothetical protein